ncbi:2-phospho-L-lactate guanylyltransferase [Lapillicoccus sp.]|uniref:2-phospho-L-lactate guanylyltransferase n=1 Tax=Lapillicoccus sp. TaxID=1909287 RepID=UPI0032666EC9
MSDLINNRATAPGSADSADSADSAQQLVWHVVIPVKGGPFAKTRLHPPEGVDHPALAMAIALDSVDAAIAAVGPAHVLVVTSDQAVAEAVFALGAAVQADPGDGLNGAVRAGLAALSHRRASTEPLAVAVLLGDVPALRPEELRRALRVAGEFDSAFLPDAEGTGTVLVTWRRSSGEEVSRFGGASAQAHSGVGYARLALDLPGLRRDVDDIDSLRTALGIGVGHHTADLLAHLI